MNIVRWACAGLTASALAAALLVGTGQPASANTPPEVPTDLLVEPGVPCATEPPGPVPADGNVRLSGVVFDVDATVPGHRERLEAQFAVWPVDRPDERIVRLGDVGTPRRTAVFPRSQLENDQTYGWQVRAADGQSYSPWSHICYFTMDPAA